MLSGLLQSKPLYTNPSSSPPPHAPLSPSLCVCVFVDISLTQYTFHASLCRWDSWFQSTNVSDPAHGDTEPARLAPTRSTGAHASGGAAGEQASGCAAGAAAENALGALASSAGQWHARSSSAKRCAGAALAAQS